MQRSSGTERRSYGSVEVCRAEWGMRYLLGNCKQYGIVQRQREIHESHKYPNPRWSSLGRRVKYWRSSILVPESDARWLI